LEASSPRRRPFFRAVKEKALLALAGLVAGLAIGIFLGWNVWPVQYYDTDFPSLHPVYKVDYAVMVGAAYELAGDWERAASRLAGLGEEEVGAWLRQTIHEAIAAGRDPTEIRHLVSLAEPLGVSTEIMAPFAGDGR